MTSKVGQDAPDRFGRFQLRRVTVPTLLACAVLSASTSWAGASDPPASVRSYAIPDHGILELVVPAPWQDSARQASDGRPPTIIFAPASGDSFMVLVTPGWNVNSRPGFNSPQAIRPLLENRGQQLLGQAVEKSLALEELKGQEAVGYFYALTDKAPKPGEYQYMTQGAVGVGDLLIAFTILHRDNNPPERQAALEMLKTARQKPKQ